VLQLLVYSLPAHKELRFLLPALQLLMPYVGRGAAAAWASLEAGKARDDRYRTRSRVGMLVVVIPQLIMWAFFSLAHQR